MQKAVYLQIISKLSGIKRFCNEHFREFVFQSYKTGVLYNQALVLNCTVSMILKNTMCFFAGLDNSDKIYSGMYNSAPSLF